MVGHRVGTVLIMTCTRPFWVTARQRLCFQHLCHEILLLQYPVLQVYCNSKEKLTGSPEDSPDGLRDLERGVRPGGLGEIWHRYHDIG